MRVLLLSAFAVSTLGLVSYQAPKHFNPMVDLLAAKKPIFGLYIPSNPRARGGRGGVTPAGEPAPAPATKTQAQLAADAFTNTTADFLFDGAMEEEFDRAFPPFAEWMKAVGEMGNVDKIGAPHLRHPIAIKTHKIAPDTTLAKQRIARQLDLGVTTLMFPETESAAEVQTGLNAMRYQSAGGTRPNNQVGTAPAIWGMSAAEYQKKADLWPLNPNGELVNWTIVESKEGLKHVREIAAVKGIGVLWPGAGTLRGVFTTVDSTTKERHFDQAGWENAIQTVLAACKEFNVPCGFPANDPATVELRMKQGFSVFVAGWGENGFKAVEYGKQASGR